MKALALAAGWVVLTASTSDKPLMPEKGRVLPFGQEAYFEAREAQGRQVFGRYPKLDADTTIDPWRFKASGNSYEFGTYGGSEWTNELTFAFRRLPGYPKMLIGQYVATRVPNGPDRDPEDYVPRYFVLQYARGRDFIGYPDFLFPEDQCDHLGKRWLRSIGMKAKDIDDCRVSTWRQVELIAKAFLRKRPSPLGVMHRIDQKTAEKPSN